MNRDVTYTINGDFVYSGTKSMGYIKPGTLVVPKEKYTKESYRFYEMIMQDSSLVHANDIRIKGFKQYFRIPGKAIKDIVKIDLRKYPLMYMVQMKSGCKRIVGSLNHYFLMDTQHNTK